MGRKTLAGLDWTPVSRAFDIAQRLYQGEVFDAKKIARVYGLTMRQSYRIMTEIERVLPVQVLDEARTTFKLLK